MDSLRKVYVSGGKSAKKSLSDRTQIIYTDNLNDADYVIILRGENESLQKEQLRDFMLAKEAGKRIKVEEKKNIELMKQTRRKLDMEIE